ncbi:hypothetical protein XENOCAPTIV_003196 [Xenoophorus captivus]|uniref:Uncharacterized protein n=1 Tax=Xenoophorus captivus TaxID=1517983 RepID=A0ABV0Q8M6_9TELE
MSSKCNMFLDPSGFSSEDITSSFNIPRTSSIAKSKRPSVSFAEGTRFSPKERSGSGQDPGAPPRSKAKTTWGVLMLSALQGQGGTARTGEEDGTEEEERENGENIPTTENQESSFEVVDQEVDKTPSYANLQVPGTSGRRRTMSNTAAHKGTPPLTSDGEVGASHKITTVYVTVTKAGRPITKTESSSEGPVQAMLRRLGSLQRQREQDGGKRKKAFNAASEAPPSEGNTPKRPLSSILKSVPEVAATACGSGPRGEGGTMQGVDAAAGLTESSYLTVGPAGEATQFITNQGAANDEPYYENVLITQP